MNEEGAEEECWESPVVQVRSTSTSGSEGPSGRRGRKRKMGETSTLMEVDMDQGPTSRIFVTENILHQTGQLIYNAFRYEPEFLYLLMNLMPNPELRRIASVCREWCSIAYEVLRKRKGNRPFTLICNGPGESFSMKLHFHESLLKGSGDVNPNVAFAAQPFGKHRPLTFLERLRNQEKINDVETIIAFGNMNMDAKYLEAYEEGDIPNVKIFFFVTGPIIFYTTPDLCKVGDSDVGLYDALSPVELGGSPYMTTLASLCFPSSSHFAVDCKTLSSESLNISWNGSPQRQDLQTQVILVFKLYDHENLDKSLENLLERAFAEGSPTVSIISMECLFLGTNEPNSNKVMLGAMLSFMGDAYMSTTVLDIRDLESLDSKFYQVASFAYSAGFNAQFAYFALLLVHSPNCKINSENVRSFLLKFRNNFPYIPIQGIASDRHVKHELARSPLTKFDPTAQLEQDLLKLQCGSDVSMTNASILMTVLVVKYPLM